MTGGMPSNVNIRICFDILDHYLQDNKQILFFKLKKILDIIKDSHGKTTKIKELFEIEDADANDILELIESLKNISRIILPPWSMYCTTTKLRA